ncbi:hypothetical protein JL720_3694 [Aureococcus anophagefferens]|nr:hypothetical protein JL720_3694 [Aureococcus anophagefferens]
MLGGGLMVGVDGVDDGKTAVNLTTARATFEDNSALLGASFYSETGLTASFRDRTTFSHTAGSSLTSLYVWMGNIINLDATSGVRCAVGTTIASQYVVPAPFEFTPFVFWSNSELCPDVKENTIGSLYPPFLVRTLSVGCEPCPRDSYTLGAGSWLGTERRDPACLPCPYGATCEAGGSGVVAKPGYKGEVSGFEGEIGAPVVAFERCPDGYCCGDGRAPCAAFDSCAEHREGPLCGSCAPGSSAALFTDACRDDGACGTAGELAQVAVLVLAAAAAYALFLYYLPCSYASEMSLCVYFWQNCFLVLQTGGSLDRLSADAADVARAVGDVARAPLFVVAVLVGGAFAAPLAALCLGRGAAVDRGWNRPSAGPGPSRDVMAEPFERRHAAWGSVIGAQILAFACLAAQPWSATVPNSTTGPRPSACSPPSPPPLAHSHAMPFKSADTNYLQGALLTALPVFCALQLPWSVTSTINAPVGRDDKLPVIANRCAKCSLAILALPCAWAAAMVYQQRHVWDDVATRAGRASNWLRRRVRRPRADASEIRIN